MADVRERKNLRQVKRLDPEATGIVVSANFVVIYSYNEADMEWEREDIEGPLFVVDRKGTPAHSLVVVNRASSRNFLQYIGEAFEYDLSDGFVMLRCEAGVYSLWFNNDDERKQVSAALEKIADSASKQDQGPAKDGAAPSTPTSKGAAKEDMPDLLKDMFQQAATEGGAGNGAVSSVPSQTPAAPPPSSFTGPNAAEQFTLSKEQMKDVLLRLVHTDKFIDILHNQYLKTRATASQQPQQQQQHQQQPQQPQQPQQQHIGHLAPSPLRQPYGMMQQPPPSMYGSPMMYGRGGPGQHMHHHAPPSHHSHQGAPPPYHQMAPSPGPNSAMHHPGAGQVGARMETPPHLQHPQHSQPQQHAHQE
ncbi:mRNA-decapping enzyme-like protein [Hondaea fermentalgiana]|uniref:mRNA-decapping enzyme-like protein n=1 Tax=Hondaea fermentalgiana TaxID=2315210 RepID=A0A2R5GSB3_9STRA|nr:mRNA-decapping enzyme-like protein [Hondaea fermentalgiana]|eukprot:GBG31251.1 mRNA-decapping enzyme-like protein [Hondaea fermentalgiana]